MELQNAWAERIIQSVMSDDHLHLDFQRRIAMVDDQIRKADMLEAENQIDAALAAYKACFEIAIRQNVPIYISQLTHIWMGVGLCYADRYQWEQALRMYQLVENMLKSTATVASSNTQPIDEELKARVQEWSRFLPKGVHAIMPEGFDPLPSLANLYSSMGLAHDNTDQVQQARGYYQRAIELFTRLNDPVGITQIWRYVGVGSRRREDWENLQIAGENMLALAEQQQDIDAEIAACQFLAQASMNQLLMLKAMEYLKRAVEAERETKHLDLEQDKRLLADFMRSFADLLGKRVARSQPSRAEQVVDPARFKPLSDLFDEISVQEVAGRGAPQLVFVIKTQRFDDTLELLQLFHLTPLPLNVKFMRKLAGGFDRGFPSDVDFWIEWNLADVDPGQPIGKVLVEEKMYDRLMEVNAQSPKLTVVLEEAKRGLFGKGRQERVAVYEPYLLDWYGFEGAVTYIRSSWKEVDDDQVWSMLELLGQRIDGYGLATGLLTQMGFLYRLMGLWDPASECYLHEIQAGLRPDGYPGLGALTAFCNLGTVYKKQQNFERAQLCYRLALHLNPNYFEPLVSLAGILEGFDEQLICLSRAYRVRPDDQFFMTIAQNICVNHSHVVNEVLALIRATSKTIDLSQPFTQLAVDDVVDSVRDLLSSLPGLVSESQMDAGPVGPLTTLDEVVQVLEQFAFNQVGSPYVLSSGPRWSVAVEELAVFSRDMQGQLDVANSPGANLQLAYAPDLVVRVTLQESDCAVKIMEEFQLPDVPETALKAMVSETVPARAEMLFKLLSRWVGSGVLYRSGDRWHCRRSSA